MQGFLRVLAGGAALLFALSACDKSRDQIVGQWKVEGTPSSMVWEFESNGRVKSGTAPGRYSFGDRNRLEIETPSATFVYEIELSPDSMIWKAPNGTRTELRRVP